MGCSLGVFGPQSYFGRDRTNNPTYRDLYARYPPARPISPCAGVVASFANADRADNVDRADRVHLRGHFKDRRRSFARIGEHEPRE